MGRQHRLQGDKTLCLLALLPYVSPPQVQNAGRAAGASSQRDVLDKATPRGWLELARARADLSDRLPSPVSLAFWALRSVSDRNPDDRCALNKPQSPMHRQGVSDPARFWPSDTAVLWSCGASAAQGLSSPSGFPLALPGAARHRTLTIIQGDMSSPPEPTPKPAPTHGAAARWRRRTHGAKRGRVGVTGSRSQPTLRRVGTPAVAPSQASAAFILPPSPAPATTTLPPPAYDVHGRACTMILLHTAKRASKRPATGGLPRDQADVTTRSSLSPSRNLAQILNLAM
ncbi:hypothetical protein GGTG_09749 [Gaeumannomyces tritici R3-111a-1]|uniref:Uncharacterized protein n=1 Tax=Gaeumannomyces tritici (strain R3-111a-1) TaxID=644352 RepID=J3P8B5_GAET3|nr:hypothetical protein GGTG_09749 [Gaeumannomyces tritici R3-111a-1]EJT72898.1 hypothetical protein GGTG_09749 [Gaeumannomyces tritici R3-111a-1]